MKFDWRAISGPVLADQGQVLGRQGTALFLHGAARRPTHAELPGMTDLVRHADTRKRRILSVATRRRPARAGRRIDIDPLIRRP
jgi:hypothetical protein